MTSDCVLRHDASPWSYLMRTWSAPDMLIKVATRCLKSHDESLCIGDTRIVSPETTAAATVDRGARCECNYTTAQFDAPAAVKRCARILWTQKERNLWKERSDDEQRLAVCIALPLCSQQALTATIVDSGNLSKYSTVILSLTNMPQQHVVG